MTDKQAVELATAEQLERIANALERIADALGAKPPPSRLRVSKPPTQEVDAPGKEDDVDIPF